MEAVNILDVVRDFEPKLRKKGVNYECLCPFHADTHVGSFFVSERRNMCYCFSCQKGGDAVYYLMEGQGMTYPQAIAYLGHKYSIEVEGSEKYKHVPVAKPREYKPVEALPTLRLPMSMYEATTKHLNDDTLVKWLRAQNWDDVQRHRIDGVLADYHIGTTQDGSGFTIFWMMDEWDNLCTGKMIKYKYNGHRFKPNEVRYNSDWIHSRLFNSDKMPQYDRDKQDWKRTYFGMHLINRWPHATVNIVESEKTAITMATAYGNYYMSVWIACGSKVYLTHERLMPLIERGRKIILYPDRDAIDEWRETANAIGYSRLSVNTEPVTRWWKESDGDHADIADVVLRMTNDRKKEKPTNISEVLDKLKERLKLEEVK